jgi:pentatricopeptide repeat protein
LDSKDKCIWRAWKAKGSDLVEEMKERRIQSNEKIIICVLKAFCDVKLVENAAEILSSMETRFGVKPDGFHCTCVLNACGDYGLVELGKKIHRHLAEHNYRDSNIWKGNLIEMYAKCNYIEESIAVFNSLKEEEKDINIWTSIISAYSVSRGSEKEALNMFTKMQQVGIKPDNRTISFVLQACCAAGMIESAAGIFFSMERNFGIKPDGYHYNCMLTACADNGLISLGKRIHNHLIEYNYPQNTILKNNLINMYGKCGCLKQAYDIFHSMKFSERDIITWTVMISVCGENKRGEEALKLFAQMQEHGITPTEQTLSCVLNSCCKSGFIDVAVEILFSMESKFGFKPIGYHYSRLLSVCADNGLLSLGKTIHKHLLDNNVPQNINLKNNLMNTYAKCGCFEDALETFNHIEESEGRIFT